MDDEAWVLLRHWDAGHDGSRDTSDEARRWANDESKIDDFPSEKGAWAASLEIAFDAGRQYERIRAALAEKGADR